MCSVNDVDSSGSVLMERKPVGNNSWNTVCQKCSEAKPVIQIMQIKHAYCRTCFLAHVNHKFRSTLGKSKMMRPSDVALASFSGSNKSLVLLHLLQAGLSEKSHKRFLFKVYVLYIDEGAVLGISVPERESNLKAVGELVSLFGFSLYFATLSSIYNSNGPHCFLWNENCGLKLNDAAEKNLHDLFSNTNTLTAKEDLLRQLRKSIMIKSASDIGCGKIFVAETGTDLAVQILSDISLGRGSQMHHDVSFCDDRLTTVKILRPMRELSSKEVGFYSVYNKIHGVQIPSFCTKAKVNESIHRLSEHFVMNLMEEFPSTVSTVFRTGDKLGSSLPSSESNGDENERNCAICKATKDLDNTECSSVQATSFSRLISSLGPAGFDNATLKPSCNILEVKQIPDPHSTAVNLSCVNSQSDSSINGHTWSEVQKFICYGCRLILHDMKPATHLPESVMRIVHQKACFEDMKKNIQEFLL